MPIADRKEFGVSVIAGKLRTIFDLESTGHVVLYSVLVGIVAGLGAAGFVWALTWFKDVDFSSDSYFPVVDQDGLLVGIFSLHDTRSVLGGNGAGSLVLATDLATAPVTILTPDDNLHTALRLYTQRRIEEIPIVKPDDNRSVICMLRRDEIIAAYDRRMGELRQGRRYGKISCEVSPCLDGNPRREGRSSTGNAMPETTVILLIAISLVAKLNGCLPFARLRENVFQVRRSRQCYEKTPRASADRIVAMRPPLRIGPTSRHLSSTAAGPTARRPWKTNVNDREYKRNLVMKNLPGNDNVSIESPGLDAVDVARLKERLQTSSEGLTDDDARARLRQHGFNELPEESVNTLRKFLSYFWGPIPWMIEVAAILSIIVQHWVDFGIIVALLVANAVVGFWEEYQAGNAIAALRKKLALRARVKRDGTWKTIPAREIVSGDLVRLRIGDIVPADAKLTGEESVEVDQSALTGESLPVSRSSGEVVYSGSVLRRGETDAFVYATGKDTYFGKTAQLVEAGDSVSHFQRAVLKIGDFLILVAVALVALILLVALFRGDPMMTTVQFALVLTVAAIPVALPTVLSVTMAVGAKILSASQAIVSRLASIEELAGMDVLCSDKTGTLTQNRLTLGDPFTVAGVTPEETIRAAALASRAEDDDPIDLAVIGGQSNDKTNEACEVTHFVPFDPVHKRTEATLQTPDGRAFKTTKGAPQVILDLSTNASQVREAVEEAIDDYASRGYRALGVARTDDHDRWQFLGVLPLYDPPREDSKATLKTAREMGCKVKMVTGDQRPIARETAKNLAMGSNILDASVFAETSHHETGQLGNAIEEADGFAQVYPEHKYHIVDVLQRRGHVVGMTGDGVNDAPALKKADVGIAVSGATDAARAAADIVLLSPGLSVIINAIEESRKIFQRMTNYAVYRIAETVRVLLFMTLCILVFNFYPVTTVMIVLLALLNDGAILSIAYDRVRYSEKPETWNMRDVLGVATVLGVVGVVESFGLLYLGERVFDLNRDMLQTLIYLKLSVAGHLTVFAARTRRPFWSIRPAPVLLWAVIGTQLIATIIAVYGLGIMTPIGWCWAGLVWLYCAVWFPLEDGAKLVAYRILDPECSSTLLKPKKH